MNMNSRAVLVVAIVTIISCKKNIQVNPTIHSINPEQGTANTLVTVTGRGLQNINSAVLDLDNVQILVNSNFNTDTSILLRVPAGSNPGKQHIVFTNSSGYQYSLPFTVY